MTEDQVFKATSFLREVRDKMADLGFYGVFVAGALEDPVGGVVLLSSITEEQTLDVLEQLAANISGAGPGGGEDLAAGRTLN